MSLYNALFGVNKFSHLLLRIIDLDPTDVPRFRDCYLNDVGDEIVVFTRTGGGNRAEYEQRNEALRRRPGFISDDDDTLDSTYAKFRYAVPERYMHVTKTIATMRGGVDDPTEKFKALLEKLQDKKTPKDDPDVLVAMEVGKSIFDQINTADPEPGPVRETKGGGGDFGGAGSTVSYTTDTPDTTDSSPSSDSGPSSDT